MNDKVFILLILCILIALSWVTIVGLNTWLLFWYNIEQPFFWKIWTLDTTPKTVLTSPHPTTPSTDNAMTPETLRPRTRVHKAEVA